MNLSDFRRIDTPEEAETLPAGVIIVETPDLWGETMAYGRIWWQTGYGTHDSELAWAGFLDEKPARTSEIEFPAYVVFDPSWAREEAA